MKLQINKYSIRFLCLPLLIIFCSIAAHSQTYVFLEASNEYNGEQVAVEYRAESIKTGHSHVIRTEDGRQYFIIPEGDEVRVKSIKDGYYPKEITIKEEDISGDEYDIKLTIQERPTGVLTLTARAEENGNEEPASFEIFFEGRMIGRGNTTRNLKTYSLTLNQAGSYQIVTHAQGFADDRLLLDIQINTPANHQSQQILLKRPAKEIAIKFLDEQTDVPVKSNVQITETASGEELYSGSPENGIILFTFENGKNYKIISEREGYKSSTKTIDGAQNEDLIIRLRPDSFVLIKVMDSFTNKEIESTIEIISPSGSNVAFKEGTNNSFIPTELGTYSITVASPGYISQSNPAKIASLTGGIMESVFRLDEADKQFRISVIDHYSREVLNNAELRVFGPGGQRVPGIEINDEGEWVFITDPEKKYFIEVNEDAYIPFTEGLTEENKQFEVELFWESEFTYYVQDVQTHEIIKNANLIVEINSEETFVYKTENDGVFKSQRKNNMNIDFRIEAEGYKSPRADLRQKPGGNNEWDVYFARIDSDIYNFKVYDYLTREPLNANLKYFIGINEVEVITDDTDVKKGVYSGSINYRIEASLADYRAYASAVRESMVHDNDIDIAMKKEFYTIKFRIEDLVTNEELRTMDFHILTASRARIPETFVATTKLYETNLDGDTRYTLEIAKDGYELYSREFDVRELVQTNLLMSVRLTEIPEEEIIEEEPETKPVAIIEETPEVVIEETPEPVLEEEKKEITVIKTPQPEVEIQEEAPIIPTSTDQMAAEFAKEESVGKRYLLDQVFFEQSSFSIKNDEIEQLNQLVKTLNGNERLIIEIVGYTDNIGDPRLNLGLSKFRAKAVANYLFYKGANPNRIKSTGFGQEQAVAQNDSEENRAKNRRVEMVLVEN